MVSSGRPLAARLLSPQPNDASATATLSTTSQGELSKMKYPSRKTWAHTGLILAIFLLGILTLWVFDPLPLPLAETYGWVFLVLGVLAVWDFLATEYVIGDSELIVHHATSRRRIRLENIEAVEEDRGFLSSLSGDGLRIKYRSFRAPSSIMVYPTDKAAFLDELAAAAPWLRQTWRSSTQQPVGSSE